MPGSASRKIPAGLARNSPRSTTTSLFRKVDRGHPDVRVETCGHLDQARDLPPDRAVAKSPVIVRDAADAVIQYPTKQEWVICALQLFQAEGGLSIERPVR